jgi:ADP-heptose:LPS heptosyltransferase
MLISGNSGLLHVAYAFGTSTFFLFGSIIGKNGRPWGKKHMVINKHCDYSPYTRCTPKCGRNPECLASIHSGEVIEAVRTIIDAS